MGEVLPKQEWSSLICSVDRNEIFAVVGTDLKGKIECWNRGAELLTAFRKEEAIGRDISLFFTETDRERRVPEREMQQALLNGYAEDERWHLRKGGSLFWASGAMTTSYGPNDEITGFTKIFRDDTNRRRTEEHIRRTNTELARFAHTAAHDLQQPIRTIANFIELTLREEVIESSPLAAEYLTIALDAATRMRALTGDLLAYAEAGSAKNLSEVVDCNAAFDVALENLQAIIIESGALVHRGSLPLTEGVPSQISQVFQNLISNGIKYRSPERTPRIFVEALRMDGGWQFSVTDNGIGIDPADQDRVFGAFERAHTESSGGSGLGLSICRKIVEAHGGKIWVESKSGQGTSFHFTLLKRGPNT